jgi:hypothetical protein
LLAESVKPIAQDIRNKTQIIVCAGNNVHCFQDFIVTGVGGGRVESKFQILAEEKFG